MSLERHQSGDSNVTPPHGFLCPQCSTAIKPGKKFCSQCGCPVGAPAIRPPAKLPRRASICPECGFENHHSDTFCKGCGGLLSAAPAAFAGSDRSGDRLSGVKSMAAPPLDPGPELKTGAAGSGLRPAALEAEAAVLSLKPFEPPTIVPGGAESSLIAAIEPAAHETGRPDAKSALFRARNIGVGSLGIAALAALMLTAVVFFLRLHAGAGSRQTLTVSGTVLAQPSSAPSASPVSSAPNTQDEHVRSTESSLKASPRKAKPGNAQQPAQEARNGKAAGAPKAASAPGSARVPETALPSLPVNLKPVITALGSLKPPALNSVPDTSQTPRMGPKAAATAPLTTAPVTTAANLPPAPANPAGATPEPTVAPTTHASNVRVGGVVLPAKVLVHPLPDYPRLARSQRLGGSVHLNATVRKDGTVTNLKIASGDLLLGGAALDAVRHWRYRPAMLDGKPVESQVDIEIKFHFP